MSTIEMPPVRSLGSRCLGAARWTLRTCWILLRSVLQFLLLAWGMLAIYYSNLPWHGARVALAVAFLAWGVWALWIDRRRRACLAFAGGYLALIVWWVCIPPSHDRPWRPEVAVLPRAIIDGDRVRLLNVRNFDFRSRHDFTARYVERDVDISHLTSVDLFISYVHVGPIAHTFVSFNFDNAPPVCVSIEARPEMGELFTPIPTMFKQFELIYVVGEERDLVRVRTDHRGEEVFLYPIRMPATSAQALFRIYLERINELAEQPEWYHLLKNSCTINIVRYANRIGRTPGFDIRLLLNGFADRYLYRTGRVRSSLPFDELRRRSRITAVAREAGDVPDFSQRIRAGLP